MEPIQPTFPYDVFLSFRGEDTRYSFTSHLYEALRRHNFAIFHDTSLPRGRSIAPQLLAAIDESKIFVVVFSKNYADSKWCLNELSRMTHCVRENNQQTILPIYLDVKQSDVCNQQGSYKEPFRNHDIQFEHTKVRKWREALHEAGQLSGLDLTDDANGDEDKLLEQVVERIRHMVHEQDLHLGVGIQSRLKEVISLLNPVSTHDTNDVRVVAISGPAGIGKTTIAKAAYDHLTIHFRAQYCCFLPDVKNIFGESNGKVTLQKMFISNLVQKDESQIQVDSYHQGIGRIEKMIKQQKVLLVLDDVDNVEQLKMLGITRAIFGRGSRIIVTTRDASVLGRVKLDATYEPRLLDEREALEVFCLDAFRQNQPKEGYEGVSRDAVCWGAGCPGVLKDIAARLRCYESVQHWKWALKDLMHNSSW